MIIAGIGSRETPQDILVEMQKIGMWCFFDKHWVRSGHADGADWAFERGAQDQCIAYLPWDGFNKHLESNAHLRVVKPNCHTIKITKEFHPAFDKLSYGALCLMCRNVCQVLGQSLDSPVDAVVCWTKDGEASGGTGQAMRIADSRGIKILNMKHDEYNTADKVIHALRSLPTLPL